MDERKRRGAILRVMCLSLMMVVAAVASLNVALPAIARDIGASQTQLQWIVDAYAVSFAALLLPAGAIGDRIGRKPVLAFGLALFGGASLIAMFAHSPAQLIGAARADGRRRGVRHARHAVRDHHRVPARGARQGRRHVGRRRSRRRRARARHLGVLLEWLDWPSVFGLNVVLAVLALAGTLAVVPSTRAATPPRLDPVGTLLSAAGLAAFVYGIIEGPERGWTAPSPSPRSSPASRPSPRSSAGSCGATSRCSIRATSCAGASAPGRSRSRCSSSPCSASCSWPCPTCSWCQGFSPIKAAAALLPMAVLVIPLSRVSPLLAARLGVRVAGAAGLTLDGGRAAHLRDARRRAVVLALPARAGARSVPASALAGAPATTAIVASLPREKQGVASAVNDVSRELGGALGIAVLGSLFNAAYRSSMTDATASLPPAAGEQARSSLAAAEQVGSGLGAGGARADRPRPDGVHGWPQPRPRRRCHRARARGDLRGPPCARPGGVDRQRRRSQRTPGPRRRAWRRDGSPAPRRRRAPAVTRWRGYPLTRPGEPSRRTVDGVAPPPPAWLRRAAWNDGRRAHVLATLTARLTAMFDAVAPGADPVVRVSDRCDLQANGGLALAKRLGRPPRDIAGDVVAQDDLADIARVVEVAGAGFINVTLSEDYLARAVAEMAADPRLGVPPAAAPERAVVDYSAPNVAKEMHVGHLRST